MRTWLTDIVREANERTFTDAELERMTVYLTGLPARLRAAEEVEQFEADLATTLYPELKKKHPTRVLYTRRFVQDVVESLRHLVHAALADEPVLFRRRWLGHLCRVIDELGLDPAEVREVYEAIRDRAAGRLTRSTRELVDPYFDELVDALTPAAAR